MNSLDPETIENFVRRVATARVPDEEIRDFLLLFSKYLTLENLRAFLLVLKAHSSAPFFPRGAIYDTCGTGGGRRANKFDVSTALPFFVNEKNIRFVKHCGRQSGAGGSGSIDFLEALGYPLNLSRNQLFELFRRTGICFLDASQHNSVFAKFAPARRMIDVPTACNIVAPFLNPVRITHRIIGTPSRQIAEYVRMLAEESGCHTLVVVGEKGFDEIAIGKPTWLWEVRPGWETKTIFFDPSQVGIRPVHVDDLPGGDPKTNVGLFSAALKRERGPIRDLVAVNAGAVLYLASAVRTTEEGYLSVSRYIDGHAAEHKFSRWRKNLPGPMA